MAKGSRRDLRTRLATLAHGCCEYCMTQEQFCPDPFSVEDIIPRSRRGRHTQQNLAFSCLGCNSFKYNFVEARDPSSGQMAPLFHPRKQRWIDHFEWDETFTQVIGLTPTGRATVVRLQLNRPGLRHLREALYSLGRHPPSTSLL